MAKRGYIFLVLFLFCCLSLSSIAASSRFASMARTMIGKYPFLRTNIAQQPLVHTYSPWMRTPQSSLHLGYYPLRSFSVAPTYGYLNQMHTKLTNIQKAVQSYFAQPPAAIPADPVPHVESIVGQIPHNLIIPLQTQNNIKNILSHPLQAKHFLEDLQATLSVQEEELEEVKTDPWYANTVKQEMIEDFVHRLRSLDHFIKQKRTQHEVR